MAGCAVGRIAVVFPDDPATMYLRQQFASSHRFSVDLIHQLVLPAVRSDEQRASRSKAASYTVPRFGVMPAGFKYGPLAVALSTWHGFKVEDAP